MRLRDFHISKAHILGQKARAGFTMVEMIISLFILAMMALSIGSSAIQARKMSDAAVYQGTALAAAMGYMEQIKSMEYQNLVDSTNTTSIPLPTKLDQGTADPLYINSANVKTITIDVNAAGQPTKTMSFTITPKIKNLESTTNLRAMEILLEYEWKAPDSKWAHKRAVRSVRSYVPTF